MTLWGNPHNVLGKGTPLDPEQVNSLGGALGERSPGAADLLLSEKRKEEH